MRQKHLMLFGFTVPIAVHLQNATLSFTRLCNDIIQVSWKMFQLLYSKFIQDNVYQILSESTGFCGRYDKNILVCFFSSQCSLLVSSITCEVVFRIKGHGYNKGASRSYWGEGYVRGTALLTLLTFILPHPSPLYGFTITPNQASHTAN